MVRTELDRVIFHSKHDGSAGYNLRKAEELLKGLNLAGDMQINDLLEIYNIKEYFDNDLFLSSWDATTKSIYEEKVSNGIKRIKEYFLALNDDNIIPTIGSLEFSYWRPFWYLFNYYQTYGRVKKETFTELLNRHPRHIRYILRHFNMVGHFDSELRNFLIGYEHAAELLLSQFEQANHTKETSYIFPKSLSMTDKESIILLYIDQHEPNLNYIRLIEHSKDSSDLKLSAKTKLRAKKKSDELNKKIFEKGSSYKMGVQITLSQDQDDPVKMSKEGLEVSISYSVKFLDERPSDPALFMIYRNLFGFIDEYGIITLFSKHSELSVFERFSMKSKNEYPAGMQFLQKNQIAMVQMLVFNHYLSQKGRSVEELILSFVQKALIDELQLAGFQITFPSKDSTFLEKIRTLAPELEFLLKQYEIFAAEGKIDFELIQIDSSPLRISDIKSLLGNKYAYAKGETTERLMHHFYSDQSLLHYVDPYKEKYTNLYDLLNNEDLKIENFLNYQQDLIKHLISTGFLVINNDGYVKMVDDVFVYLIGELYRNEVISYWHFPKEVRQVLDKMESDNLIRFENTLFAEPEISYYNYYLNKKGYTNGLNIRNKYLHGSNSGLEKDHEFEYYILLKLIILTMLKIVDDIILQKRVSKEA